MIIKELINCETVNEDFAIAILGDLPLRRVVKWIQSHLKPIEVFSEDQICEYARCYFEPEAIYAEMDLDRWATDHGYIKPDPMLSAEDNLDEKNSFDWIVRDPIDIGDEDE
jgi:hypothetical protein